MKNNKKQNPDDDKQIKILNVNLGVHEQALMMMILHFKFN